MSPREEILRELSLVKRCLQGDQAAWSELWQGYHPGLCHAIRRYLGPTEARDKNRVEDLAAAAWCRIQNCTGGRGLAAYKSEKARLATFLAALGRREVGLRHRRHDRLVPLSAEPAVSANDAGATEVWVEEFLATLTPHRATFTRAYLLGTLDKSALPPLSAANIEKLTQRVFADARAFAYGLRGRA